MTSIAEAHRHMMYSSSTSTSHSLQRYLSHFVHPFIPPTTATRDTSHKATFTVYGPYYYKSLFVVITLSNHHHDHYYLFVRDQMSSISLSLYLRHPQHLMDQKTFLSPQGRATLGVCWRVAVQLITKTIR